mgnify:CR=1 FL=1
MKSQIIEKLNLLAPLFKKKIFTIANGIRLKRLYKLVIYLNGQEHLGSLNSVLLSPLLYYTINIQFIPHAHTNNTNKSMSPETNQTCAGVFVRVSH